MKPETSAPRRIVVVEDNDDARELLRELLELWGHHVETAADGVTGAERIIAWRPDVALVDLGLPDIDGFEVAARVCKALGRHDVLLVALSGFGEEDIHPRGSAVGFSAYLTKPPDLEALAELLDRGQSAPARDGAHHEPR